MKQTENKEMIHQTIEEKLEEAEKDYETGRLHS